MARQHVDPLDEEQAEKALLDYLGRSDYQPVPQRELLHRMHVPRDALPAVRRVLRRLVQLGRVHKIRGGKLVASPSEGTLRGILNRRGEGFAFVVPEGGGEEVFIAPGHLGEAMAGDRVAVRITGRSRDGRLYGLVSGVEQGRREVLGLYYQQGRAGAVQPFEPAMREPIHVPAAFRHGASHLHAVRVELVRPASPGDPPQGKVLELLGHLDEPGTDVLVVTHKYGLPMEFPDAVVQEAERLPRAPGGRELTGRERFEAPPPVTIDGPTARDFDDAIAVRELASGGFRLFVHIADVAHFARPGGELDTEARRRGNSVYFPDRVLPMFPERLSNDLCSLRPGEDRLVQSVILDFAADGKLRKVRFADGVIRSAARLTYDQVAAVIENQGGHGVADEIVPMLLAAHRLSSELRQRRRKRGSIDFDIVEPQILLDVEGTMTGVAMAPRNDAHRLIEEFMLSANEAVADHLERHESACLFRVHEPPDPLKLEVLGTFVEHFGLKLSTRNGPAPGDIQRLLAQAGERPESRVIHQVALRSMMQARYSADNLGHFGLASPAYCHFTSPIRRYADLVTHRLLRALRQGRGAQRAHEPDGLEALAQSCSELERNAEAAERELLLWKKVAYMAGRTGEEFDAIVTGVTRFGLFVQLVDSLVEGLLRVELLGPERFDFREGRYELLGTRSGRAYRLGDQLRVRVLRVDRVLQRIDVGPVAEAARRPREAPRSPGPRAPRPRARSRAPGARAQSKRRRRS